MFESISPAHSISASRVVELLATEAGRLPHATRGPLTTRYEYIYGDLGGQRPVSFAARSEVDCVQPADAAASTKDMILALESYFSLLCNIISISSAAGNSGLYLQKVSALDDPSFVKWVGDVATGRAHVSLGLNHYKSCFELDWYVDSGLPQIAATVRPLIASIANLFKAEGGLTKINDPIQILHDAVFPQNLSHITGQFYTPPWLCSLLSSEMDFAGDPLVIDPFCGSGAFLMAALDRLMENGRSVQSAMQLVLGIDLSPSACVAARTNLVLYAVRAGVDDLSTIPINVLCADSLAPSVAQGVRERGGLFQRRTLSTSVDGEVVDFEPNHEDERASVSEILGQYGFATSTWIDQPIVSNKKRLLGTAAERRVAEHMATFMLKRATIVLTNPPWVGWEYMSRPYREYTSPAWKLYSLFEQSGMKASFLKEDLSTLCIVAACDRYLDAHGKAAMVLRPATMQSELAGRGARRLSVSPNADHLRLTKIRLFDGIQIFGRASAPAATWTLEKGRKTEFPVPVVRWKRTIARWQPTSETALPHVLANIREDLAACNPTDPSDGSSRWAIADANVTDLRSALHGKNALQPRIGFFTGGANAVFYMNVLQHREPDIWLCENILERVKKPVRHCTMELESRLLSLVVRGRDISFWGSSPTVYVLCPHTATTKMYPFTESVMREKYPNAFSYMEALRPELEARLGFAGWEEKIHKENFYTLQRIGDYTFKPFKVCWNYISADFVVSVVGMDERGRPILPNDKVVFIGFDDEEEAYFVAGILSSALVRAGVISSASSRQVSTTVIKNMAIPTYNGKLSNHKAIAEACRSGHERIKGGDYTGATVLYEVINDLVSEIYGIGVGDVLVLQKALKDKLGYYPFRNAHPGQQRSTSLPLIVQGEN